MCLWYSQSQGDLHCYTLRTMFTSEKFITFLAGKERLDPHEFSL